MRLTRVPKRLSSSNLTKGQKALWEDMQDVLVCQLRRDGQSIPFERVKADLIERGKLPKR